MLLELLLGFFGICVVLFIYFVIQVLRMPIEEDYDCDLGLHGEEDCM